MKSDLKAQWVEALRSDRYKQGKGALRVSPPGGANDTWCCLGVLCNLIESSAWAKVAQEGDNTRTWKGNRGMLWDTDLKYVGLTYRDACRLTEMNDEQGRTFKEIAAWIELNISTE